MTPPSLAVLWTIVYISVVRVTAMDRTKKCKKPKPLVYLIGNSQPMFGEFTDLTFGGALYFGG